MGRAADLVADAVRADGVVHAFGTGHSEALAMEIAGRAGGLVPTNRIALRDLVLHGGEPAERARAACWSGTRRWRTGSTSWPRYDPPDVFVLASNSGVNGAMVEFATLVKERGHRLIAITSAQHSGRMASRHPSGRKLADLADVVLDNGAPYGDATLPLPGGGAVGAVSSITAALLAQQVVVEVVARLLAAGERPPVYLSANIAGGDEHNTRAGGPVRRPDPPRVLTRVPEVNAGFVTRASESGTGVAAGGRDRRQYRRSRR